MRCTCKKVDSIKYLLLSERVDKKIVSFKVLIIISIDDSIFEVDGGGGDCMVEDDLIGRFGQEEIEMDVVFLS